MTIVIAEAGINHNGDMSLALRLIDAAVAAKADYVKFQLFHIEKYRNYQLSAVQMRTLHDYCIQYGIGFLCTPFDKQAVDDLEKIVSIYKVGSGQANDVEFLTHINSKGKPVILSTGMSEFSDIRHSLTVLDVETTLLHCVSRYPTPANEANLARMQHMMANFACPVGYSDHTEGIDIALAAVALGAVVIEKHLTLDKSMEGPDHKASITPDELKALVRGVRNIELACSDS